MKFLTIISLLFGCTTPDSTPEQNKTPEISAKSPAETKRVQAQKDANFEENQAKNILHKKQLYNETPESAQKLLPLLSAHHANDLPDKKILDKHVQAEQGLIWIAQSEHNIGVRSRAIHLLHLYDSPETTAALISIAKEEKGNYLLRSAALSSIATWPLEKRTAQAEILSVALDAKNPIIVVNAITAAESIESLSQKVVILQKTHSSPLVRGTIKK